MTNQRFRRATRRTVATIVGVALLMTTMSTQSGAWYAYNETAWQAMESWVMPTYLSGTASLDTTRTVTRS